MALGAFGLVCACLLLLLFGGVQPQTIYIQRFSRAGDDITLPCDRLKHLGPNCSDVNWQYDKPSLSPAVPIVSKGKVVDSEASRLTLLSNCSLRLHNVTEDYFGQFNCRHGDYSHTDTAVYLNVLTVSRAAPDSSSNIPLECRLERYDRNCRSGAFLWLDQTRSSLSGEKKGCVSYLTVEPESPDSRTFTCQYEERSEIKVSAEFRLKGKRETQPTEAPGGDDKNQMYIIIGAVASLVVLLIVAAVVLFKIKSKRRSPQTKETSDFPMSPPPTDPVVDPDNGVTYAMIDHKKTKGKKQVVVEDSVTYSAVSIKPTASTDQSTIYSTVNKTN